MFWRVNVEFKKDLPVQKVYKKNVRINQMQDCIFCRIAKKEIPAKIIFENEIVLCFLDAHPIAKGHCLVIPKNVSFNRSLRQRWIRDHINNTCHCIRAIRQTCRSF